MQETSENTAKLICALGSVIKKYRKSQGKTMYGISAEISMSKSTWREAEIGACKDVKLTTIWKIAEGLDVSPAKLLEDVSKELGHDFSLTGV